MEHVFGIIDGKEVVTTQGSEHSDLSGLCTVVRRYPGRTITDNFRVIGKQFSGEDSAGQCYDRYEIDNHSRDTDKTQAVMDELEKTNAMLDFVRMMTGIDIPMDEEGDGGEML